MSCKYGYSRFVQKGETLYSIAQQEYGGHGEYWSGILKPDGTPFTEEEAHQLSVGQEVCITRIDAPLESQKNMTYCEGVS